MNKEKMITITSAVTQDVAVVMLFAELGRNEPDFELIKLVAPQLDDINVTDVHGNTLISAAAAGGFEKETRILLICGADPSIANRYKETPLHFAAKNGNHTVINLLIKCGVDVDALDNIGDTPLGRAITFNNSVAFNLLMAAGVKVGAKAVDDVNTVLLHAAARKGTPEMIGKLIESGIDVNSKDSAGATALHFAANYGRIDNCEQLLSKGANPCAETEAGERPLQWVDTAKYPALDVVLSNAAYMARDATASSSSPA